jgi:hypothetical protein
VYLLDNVEKITKYDQAHILEHVHDDKLLHMLQDPNHDAAFEETVLRKINLEAYPYQMQLKFAQMDIKNDDARNERLIAYFNEFFGIDYEKTLEKYCQECNREALAKTFLAHKKGRYEEISKASALFTDFVLTLLNEK